MRNEAVTVVLLCLTFGAVSARAGDWPQWGGTDGRNMVSAEKGLPTAFEPGQRGDKGVGIDPATTKNVRWVARLGSYAYGNPTVANGRLFIGIDDSALRDDPRLKRSRSGLVHCYDTANGKLLWRLVVPKRTRMPKGAHYGHQHLGVCSSPTVDGDRVYVVTNGADIVCLDVKGLADGNDGPFKSEGQYMVGPGKKPVALKPSDADILWTYDVIDEVGAVPHDTASCSVLVHDRFLYTSTSNGVDGPHKKAVNPDAPSFIVLDKLTGRLVAIEDEGISKRLWHCQWAPPSCGVVNGQTFVFVGGNDGVLYAFKAPTDVGQETVKLQRAWAYDCNPLHYRLRNGKPIPYYDGDKRKKRGNKNDGTYVGPSGIIATPVFHQGRVYIAIGQDPLHGRGRGMLHCVDAAKGTKVWSYDGLDRTISTVAIADGLLYVPDVAGRLHCLEAGTGKPVWVHETKTETWGSPLVADGKVYVGTKTHFHVFRHGRKVEQLAEVRPGAPIYSTPIAADGVLYVASNRYLWACQESDR
jgi:outer membrane protein assembly factor BamB